MLSSLGAQSDGESVSVVTTSPDVATQAAAAIHSGAVEMPRSPDFLEELADALLAIFDVRSSENTWQHYAIAGTLLIGFYLLRNLLTLWIFGSLKKLAARTRTTFDDKLFPSLEAPVSTFIALVGIFAALKILKLDPATDEVVSNAATVAFLICFFWALIRTLNAFLDHLTEIAKARGAGVAAFMPWIKKTLVTVFVILGVLMVAQSLGADVKTFLAGLGLGGLAFALAAQDTIANVFGSVVIAVDQPFRIGEFVQIGSHMGTVEDIGLRSTRLRTPQRTLIVIPNKTVAADAINNFTKMPQRRVDQTIGITYDTTPEQMEQILAEMRTILEKDPGVHQDYILVRFAAYGAYSLDIQVVYFTADPDMRKSFEVRERVNLAFMRAVRGRGLSFAFPTQTMEFGESARKVFSAGRAEPQS